MSISLTIKLLAVHIRQTFLLILRFLLLPLLQDAFPITTQTPYLL